MVAYGSGELGDQPIALSAADHIIAIGSDRMMAAVGVARHNQLKPYLKSDHFAIGSINSPMQCMMKEICAQCLQPHKDPATGKIVSARIGRFGPLVQMKLDENDEKPRIAPNRC